MSANVLPIEECFKILQRLKQVGLSEDERDDFVAKALIGLADSNKKTKAHFEDSAKLAKEIDDAFYEEAKFLYKIASMFPFVAILWQIYFDWIKLYLRWRICLRFSMTLATDLADVLRRFDQVYLEQVENIQTDTERLSAMANLTAFITELDEKDKSAELSRDFLDLKRDVAAFGEKYSTFKLSAIAPLTKDIETLDELIKDTQNAVRGIFAGTRLFEAVGAETEVSKVFLSLQFYRQEKVETLRKVNQAQAGIDSLVAEPMVLMNEFEPANIAQLVDNLLDFAELWASVRSQCVQIKTILAGGMEAATDTRFKKEVRLAREESRPLREGLLEYNRQLYLWIDTPIGV